MSGQACAQCRRAKRRCDIPQGLLSCSSCVKRHLSCSLVDIQPLVETTTTPPLHITTQSATLSQYSVEPEIAIDLVDLYIRYMHDKPHALFHEPSLKESVANGSVSQVVLLSILGLAARYVTCFSTLR
jgi:hypothetical protein